MKKLPLLASVVCTVLLAACGQQELSSNPKAGLPENATFNGGIKRQVEIRPASELPAFLDSNPEIKARLEKEGNLQNVLSLASKAQVAPQQTTNATFCTIDYATDVNFDEYVGGSAAMYCQYTLSSSTTLEVITRRSPDFAQVDGLARAPLYPASTNLSVSTQGSLQNEPGQYYCTNTTAFIVLTDGRYASSRQGPWDCISGF